MAGDFWDVTSLEMMTAELDLNVKTPDVVRLRDEMGNLIWNGRRNPATKEGFWDPGSVASEFRDLVALAREVETEGEGSAGEGRESGVRDLGG